ncbi:MAG: NADH-quinone oxidoreductase subunit N [Geobacteraceae bacterium]
MTAADLWTLMPFFFLACGSLLILLGGAFRPGRYGTWIGVAAALAAAGWVLREPPLLLASQLGLAATPFARFFTMLFCLTAVLVLLLSHSYNERHAIRGEGTYPATVLFAAFGMSVLAASLNLLTLFLGLEALSFAFYILTAIDRERPQSAEAGLKYLLMGATAAAFIAFGIALFYAGTGTLAIADAVNPLGPSGVVNPLVVAGWGLVLMGLAFKVSLVPAHLWTPDVYQGAPVPVTAFLSTGSKVAAFAALLLLLPAMGAGFEYIHGPLWWLCLLSMVVGNLAALRQRNLKRLLAYSSVAQMGYVTLALVTGSVEGFRAVVFYLVVYTVTNLTAFGAIASLTGECGLDEIEDCRGIGRARPFRGAVLAVSLFSLAGIPPMAGFMGKFILFAAALRGGEIALAVAGIVMAAISVYYYLRVVAVLYAAENDRKIAFPSLAAPEFLALGVTAFFILFWGVFPGTLLAIIGKIIQ